MSKTDVTIHIYIYFKQIVEKDPVYTRALGSLTDLKWWYPNSTVQNYEVVWEAPWICCNLRLVNFVVWILLSFFLCTSWSILSLKQRIETIFLSRLESIIFMFQHFGIMAHGQSQPSREIKSKLSKNIYLHILWELIASVPFPFYSTVGLFLLFLRLSSPLVNHMYLVHLNFHDNHQHHNRPSPLQK